MMNMQMLASLASVYALCDGDLAPRQSGKHSPVRGRIVGWDNAKKVDKQGRNEICSCGSGKKYKKCCMS